MRVETLGLFDEQVDHVRGPSADLAEDKLYGHVKKTKTRTKFLEFCRYLRTLYPADVRIAIVCDNFSPHLTTKRCRRVADWAEANNVPPGLSRSATRVLGESVELGAAAS